MEKLINLEKAFNYCLNIIQCKQISDSLHLVQASDNQWYLIGKEIEGQFSTKEEALIYLDR